MTVQERVRGSETPTVDGVSRRGFLAGSGLVFGLAVTGSSVTLFDAKAATKFQPSIWVTLGTDGRMQILAPAGEMGQGVLTAMPMLFAEEFDADWGMVEPVFAEVNPEFGNPLFGGFMLTGASRTTRGYWKKLRIAGAQARRILLDAAAKKWGVPVGELTTQPSMVVHAKSGKTLTYGEIAKFAAIPSKMPKITEKDLKPRSEWRIIGNPDIVRVDVPWKVNGSAKFGIDTFVPGMLYASILRSPAAGNGPKKIDKAAAMKVKGVVAVIPLPYGVAVVGTDIWATKAGKAKLKVTWTNTAPSNKYTTDSIRKAYLAAAKDPKAKAVVALKRGDVAGAMKKAAKTMTADYWADHVYHATMEPMNCVAWVKAGGEVEIWAPTQAPSINTLVASKVAGTKPNKVTVHQTLMGGGYGRRFEQDFLVDALILSKSTKKPVKVIWSREDDVQHDEYRPAVAQRLQASLDKNGKIIGWTHRVVAESVFARSMPGALKAAKGVDDSVVDGQQLMYQIAS
jgi:isoquinoline 1-oxidoreductase beta subunit